MNITNELIIPISSSSDKVLAQGGIGKGGIPRCLCLVGAPGVGVVTIQIPVVANPLVDTDAHWQDYYQEGELKTLSSSNMALFIPFNIEYRVVKPAGNSFGVRWS